MYRLEFEAAKRFFKLLRVVFRVSKENVKRASTSVQRLVYMRSEDFELLDDLCFDEAVLLCAFLEKWGFKAGRDYGVYRLNRLYGLALKEGCLQAVKPLLRELRMAGTVCRIASNILKHWRGGAGRKPGDAYEAVDWAYRISSARDRLFTDRCPHCGGSGGVMLKEHFQGEKYIIYARRICCRREEKLTIPFKENLNQF
ncbi:MAG: hypothetical protein QXL91_02820 [Candidatus Bathyarchaeia archaeon]